MTWSVRAVWLVRHPKIVYRNSIRDALEDSVLAGMSSTNRSNNRLGPDYYITPVPSILEFFDALETDWRDILDTSIFSFEEPLTVLDPCAGGDPRCA